MDVANIRRPIGGLPSRYSNAALKLWIRNLVSPLHWPNQQKGIVNWGKSKSTGKLVNDVVCGVLILVSFVFLLPVSRVLLCLRGIVIFLNRTFVKARSKTCLGVGSFLSGVCKNRGHVCEKEGRILGAKSKQTVCF